MTVDGAVLDWVEEEARDDDADGGLERVDDEEAQQDTIDGPELGDWFVAGRLVDGLGAGVDGEQDGLDDDEDQQQGLGSGVDQHMAQPSAERTVGTKEAEALASQRIRGTHPWRRAGAGVAHRRRRRQRRRRRRRLLSGRRGAIRGIFRRCGRAGVWLDGAGGWQRRFAGQGALGDVGVVGDVDNALGHVAHHGTGAVQRRLERGGRQRALPSSGAGGDCRSLGEGQVMAGAGGRGGGVGGAQEAHARRRGGGGGGAADGLQVVAIGQARRVVVAVDVDGREVAVVVVGSDRPVCVRARGPCLGARRGQAKANGRLECTGIER